MLTQRTIARFQRFLSGLMQQEFYGFGGRTVALPVPDYYNRLYEDGVPRLLLDVLGKRAGFQPVPITLALFEGQAVAEANGASRVTDTHRRLGITYLLCFMAVAVRFCEQLPWEKRSAFEPDLREFIESLRTDGFAYRDRIMREIDSGDAIVPVPLDGEPPRAVAPAKPPAPKPAPSPEPEVKEVTTPVAKGHEERSIKSHFWRDAGWVGVIVAIIAIFAAIFNVELHNLLLQWWQRLTSLP